MTAPVYTVTNRGNSDGIANFASGKIATDAGTPEAHAIVVGFTPRYVRWINATDRIQSEWFEGMAADSGIEQAAAGTGTLETSGGITIAAGQFTVHADLIPASKVFYWQAMG